MSGWFSYNLEKLFLSSGILVHVSKVEPVSTISQSPPGSEKDDENGAPDHDASKEPHQDDPDEGEEAGSDQSYSNHPVSLQEVSVDFCSRLS